MSEFQKELDDLPKQRTLMVMYNTNRKDRWRYELPDGNAPGWVFVGGTGGKRDWPFKFENQYSGPLQTRHLQRQRLSEMFLKLQHERYVQNFCILNSIMTEGTIEEERDGDDNPIEGSDMSDDPDDIPVRNIKP